MCFISRNSNIVLGVFFTGAMLLSSGSVYAWGLDTLKKQTNKVTDKVVDQATDKAIKDNNEPAKPKKPVKPKRSRTRKSRSSGSTASSPRRTGPRKGESRQAFIERRRKERAKRQNSYKIANKGKVNTEPMPPNKYTGSDKAALEKTIRNAWQQKYPKDEILAVCFHAQNWSRNTKAKSNSTSVYVNDTSILPVKMIVKTDDKVATIFPAYLNKDHQKGNQIRPGVATKKNSYVIKQMLISNIK